MSTETTGALAKALAAFQAEMPTVPKSQTADTGKFRYTYASLADVSEAAMPLLAKHGLAFATVPEVAEQGRVLRGVLLHSSGEQLTGVLPISGTDMQSIGSALTYGRRYLMGCLTGIVTDDDDDGQAATRHAKQQRPAPQQSAAGQASPKASPSRQASEKQVKMMGALMSKLGMSDRDLALQFVADVIGRQVASRNELTSREASQVIDALQKDLNGPTPPDPHDGGDPWADAPVAPDRHDIPPSNPPY